MTPPHALLEWCQETFGLSFGDRIQADRWLLYDVSVAAPRGSRGRGEDGGSNFARIERHQVTSGQDLAIRTYRYAQQARVGKLRICAFADRQRCATITCQVDLPFAGEELDLRDEGPSNLDDAHLEHTRQLLAQNQRLFDLLTAQSEASVKGSAAMVRSLQDEVLQLRSETWQLYRERAEEMKASLVQEHERGEGEVERYYRVRNRETLHEFLTTGMAILQSRLSPSGSVGQSQGLARALANFCAALDPSQYARLGEILSPEQRVLFNQLLEALADLQQGGKQAPESPQIASSPAGSPSEEEPPSHSLSATTVLRYLRDNLPADAYAETLEHLRHAQSTRQAVGRNDHHRQEPSTTGANASSEAK